MTSYAISHSLASHGRSTPPEPPLCATAVTIARDHADCNTAALRHTPGPGPISPFVAICAYPRGNADRRPASEEVNGAVCRHS
ncbi:hypothetical protein CCO02nite_24210 [Cellulomonas composti]|uniref:Uncharacterized protein n=1 Tax=Cellulomonas composti TaxID=266130 RepID=A0A511JDG1_9CELL|nr:hypothetical protein CCO02nite_24210 [Cellulomonas composti]